MSERFVLFDPDGPDLEFDGERIIDHRYPGEGRWCLYKTLAGKYVLERKQSALRGAEEFHYLDIFEGFEPLAEELSKSWEGKDLLERIGRPNRRFIE